MPAGCPIIRKPDDINLVAAALQRSGTVSSVIRHAPQLGFLIRAINPAADMSDENLSRHVIAHAVLREERQTAATAALSLVAKSTPLSKLFVIDDKGFVTLMPKGRKNAKPVHINDLLEGKSLNRYQLTAEQKAGLKLRKDIWNDARFYYNQFGGKLSVEDDLFPRQIHGWVDPMTGKLSLGDGLAARSRYGGSPLSVGGTFTRSRAMNPDGSVKTSAQMVGDGWRYVDPDAVLHAKVLEVSRRTADEQFVRWLTAQPNILKKKDILGSGAKTGVHDARWGMHGFDAAQTPGLAGYYGTKEQVDYINDLLSSDTKAVIPGVTWLVNESRGLIASMDFGTTGVQLLTALGADAGHLALSAASLGRLSKPSNIFGTAVYNSFKSWFSETNLTNYYASNKDVIDRWAPYLGGLKNSEYVSNLLKTGSKSVVTKIPTMRRFARSFEASLDIAKIEYIKSLERINGPMSRSEMEALGGWVRNSTGMTSTGRLGVSARQQDIEATWLFFSPRFTRSLFAMTATLLKADKAGHEARLALGGFAAAATTMYLAAAAATGQEPDLNPTKGGRFNADFMTLRIGDNRVGIGGGMRALARLSAESYESAKDDPTRFISPDFRGADSNPLLAFWRSRSAPLTGTLLDIYSGEDFKGTPIKDGNDYIGLLKGRTLPFSLQAALEANGQADTRAGVALAAGFGMNSSPISSYQLYDEYLKGVRTADGDQRFPEGANTAHTEENDFKNFIQYDPYASKFKANYEEARLTGSRSSQDIQKILDERSRRIEAADKLLAESGDYRRYRTQINTIRADSRTTMQTLHLDSIRQSGDKKVVQSWYETYADPRAIDPVTGGIDSDGLESLQDTWKRENPGEWERLIEDSETIGASSMETQLRRDRKAIADAGWWDADQTSWDELKEIITSRALEGKVKVAQYKSFADYQLARRAQYTEQFRAAGRPQPELLADIAMQKDKLSSAFTKLRTRNRIILQRDNPELITLLERWGYNHVSMLEYRMATQSAQSALQ